MQTRGGLHCLPEGRRGEEKERRLGRLDCLNQERSSVWLEEERGREGERLIQRQVAPLVV